MKTLSLRQFKETKQAFGFISVSTVHSDTGFTPIDYVSDDWVANAPRLNGGRGMSLNCTPKTVVYIQTEPGEAEPHILKAKCPTMEQAQRIPDTDFDENTCSICGADYRLGQAHYLICSRSEI